MKRRIIQKMAAGLLILAMVFGQADQAGAYVRADNSVAVETDTEDTLEDKVTKDSQEAPGENGSSSDPGQSGSGTETEVPQTSGNGDGAEISQTPGDGDGTEVSQTPDGGDETDHLETPDSGKETGSSETPGDVKETDSSETPGTDKKAVRSSISSSASDSTDDTEGEKDSNSAGKGFDSAAGRMLESLLDVYFPNTSVGGLYDAVLGMSGNTRTSMADAYEKVLLAQTEEDKENKEFQEIVSELGRALGDAAEEEITGPMLYSVSPFSAPSAAVELRKLRGEGSAFMYYDFVETTEFETGVTYAFLNDVYGPEDAVSMLGSGAILKILESRNTGNNAQMYMQFWYGQDAEVTKYVDVITKGKGFDNCPNGGLYTVPGTGSPTEYRYFCRAGGAQNCGPFYAYTYKEETLTADNVSASLNDIEKRGSENPEDYTVTLTFDGRTVTLDPSGYSVSVANEDEVTIVVSDDSGNSITTVFRAPLAAVYDANGGIQAPDIQTMWRGEETSLSDQAPVRDGYSFEGWEDEDGTVYQPGQTIESPQKVLRLLAQWRDTQPPEVSYSQVQVYTRTADAGVRSAIEEALTVTDNEPVEECTVEIGGFTDIAETAGNKTVTVTVTDRAGNRTVKDCTVSVVARPVEFRNVNFTEDTKTLSAVLYEPGSAEIKETGFVWGIMTSPTVSLNNGHASTASPVTEPNGEISVPADVQEGITWYGRAYAATADGVTYYSDEITFGIGLPAYGTFTIKNNGDNTFTVERSGGSEGEQLVYFRTVNGSAAGGTHFNHQNSVLTFSEGETQETITIAEQTANTAYSSGGSTEAATAYANADRTYSVSIYRVTGGGSLGDTTTATRTMTARDAYKVARTIYTADNERVMDYSGNVQWVSDRSGGSRGDIYWVSNRNQNTHPQKHNYNSSAEIEGRYGSTETYILDTADSYLYRYALQAREDEDGYEHAWMGTHAPYNAGQVTKLAGDYTTSPISLSDSVAGQAIWTANFLVAQGYNTTKYYPTSTVNQSEDEGDNAALQRAVYGYNAADGVLVSKNGQTYARIGINDTVYNYFSASGADHDRWYVRGFTDYTVIDDSEEPQVLAVAPMSGGLYKTGDTFTVSVIFDEIVDSTNSTLGNVRLSTSWGPAAYAGGADTNVLYFTGTVIDNPDKTLQVTSMTNSADVKDMCDTQGTSCAGGSGTAGAEADASKPVLSVTAKGVANGTGTAVVKVEDKDITDGLSYTWTDSSGMPVSGWIEASAEELAAARSDEGLALSIRKDPGSGNSNGKWYLHVIGTYDTTGATTYDSDELDFGTKENPVPGGEPPVLTASTDNTDWARERTISVDAAASGDSALRYRPSGGTAWTDLSMGAKSVTVTDNGYYTFILTAGDQTITRNVYVEKIDLNAPDADIGSPTESGTEETAKDGVYTKLTLPISFSDVESGIVSGAYAWTDSASDPAAGEWQTLALDTGELTYMAAEDTETVKYLHIRVTDRVGYTRSAVSSAYTVISQTAAASHAPKITLTGAPAKWTNDMPTLIWRLTDYEGKDYTVSLPGGSASTASTGNFLATENGTYTVTVTDNEYGVSNSAEVVIDKLDFTGPEVSATGISSGWADSSQTVTVSASDDQSGVDKTLYAVVSTKDTVPGDSELKDLPADGRVTVSGTGTWYIYYKSYDNAGDDSEDVQREANITDGFSNPIMIDTTEPKFTASGGTTGVPPADGLNLSLKAEYGISGGKVTIDGKEISDLSADASPAGSEKSAGYTVKEKGAYIFTITSGAGKTAAETVNVYETELDAQNSTSAQPQIAVSGGKLTEPSEPVRQGYDFAGWYTEKTGGVQWDFDSDTVSKDMTLYARWTADTDTKYVVKHWTQNMDGGDEINTKNYTLADTEDKAGVTNSTLTLSELKKNFAGCTYLLGQVDGSTVTTTTIRPDGTLEINLYYTRDTISGTVSITGTTLSGSGLTAQTSGLNVPEETKLSYQWYYADDEGNEDIDGATDSTYELTDRDIGKKLGVRVTAENYRGSLTSRPTDVVKANLSGSITIEGNLNIDSTLTVNTDEMRPSGATVTWKWYRVDKDGQETEITGAQSSSYVLTLADYGCRIKAEAEGNGYYQGTLTAATEDNVQKKRQNAPEGTVITASDETIDNKNDGQIHGLDADTMEYRKYSESGEEEPYLPIPKEELSGGTLSGLEDGLYQIRYKETKEYAASDPYTVVVGKGGYYTVTLPDAQQQTGYTIEFAEGFGAQASHNGTSSFVFKRKDGYTATENIRIALNDDTKGRIEAPDDGSTDGTYVITDITGDVAVTVTGVEDRTPPEIVVKVGTSSWEEFLNTITFGYFFNETQKVDVTAKDAGSGVDKVYYHLSETAMSEEQVRDLEESDWTEYDGRLSLDKEKQYIVYVKAADKDGNISCVSSDGLVFDWTPPVMSISGVSTGWQEKDQTVTLTPSDTGSGLAKAWYKVMDTDRKIPKDDELKELPANGKITVSGDGVWYIYYRVWDKAAEARGGVDSADNITEGFAGPVRIDTVSPSITVTGAAGGAPSDDGLEITLKASYGFSGGRVTINGREISGLGADAARYGSGTAGNTKTAVYTVKAPGVYTLNIESRTGRTGSASVTVYETRLDAQNGRPSGTCLTVKGGKLTQPEDPKRTGYVFDGWYTQAGSGVRWDFRENTVTDNMTLYAHWRPASSPAENTSGQGAQRTDGTGDTDDSTDDRNAAPQRNTGENSGDGAARRDTGAGSDLMTWEEASGRPVRETMDVSSGDGRIRVTVESLDEQGRTDGNVITGVILNTFDRVVLAALTEEEQQAVRDGAHAEIRLVVTKLETSVPQSDRQGIEDAVDGLSQEIQGLRLGTYIDISIEKRIDYGEWEKMRELNEELEIVLDVPPELSDANLDYWVIRNHEGTCDLLEDLDEEDETITIRTGLFSTYAILYTEAGTETACFWHWLSLAAGAAGALAAAAASIFLRRRRKYGIWTAAGTGSILSVVFAALGSCSLDWLAASAGILAALCTAALLGNRGRKDTTS